MMKGGGGRTQSLLLGEGGKGWLRHENSLRDKYKKGTGEEYLVWSVVKDGHRRINNICKTTFFHLYNIRRIIKFFSLFLLYSYFGQCVCNKSSGLFQLPLVWLAWQPAAQAPTSPECSCRPGWSAMLDVSITSLPPYLASTVCQLDTEFNFKFYFLPIKPEMESLLHILQIYYTLFSYKKIFYKNIEAEICEILRKF